MKLSILDQVPVSASDSASQAIQNSIQLAQLADQLGYERIWYSEHHGAATLASAAPEILITYIASVTKRIRVGSGGIMMMHYSPLKMAEVFKMLTTLYPNRIDFGVGRAPGGDHFSSLALNEGKQPNAFNLYDKLMDTMMFMTENFPSDHLYSQVQAAPIQAPLPEMWLLGSSGNSAAQAGRFGMGYSFAQFISGQLNAPILDIYRNQFTPSEFMEKPQINVGYFITACETTEEAEYHASSLDLSMLLRSKGMPSKILPPAEAVQYPYTEMDRMHIQENRKRMLVGSAKEVAETLRQHEVQYGVNEAMLVTITDDHAVRLNSYRLLANELLI